MPCTVESHPIGRDDVMRWFCCNCPLGGPLNLTIELYCPYCHHRRCPLLQCNDCGENDGSTEREAAHTIVPHGSQFTSQLEPITGVPVQDLGAGHSNSLVSALIVNDDLEYAITDSSVGLDLSSQRPTSRASRFREPNDLRAIPEAKSSQHGRHRSSTTSLYRRSCTVKRKRSSDAIKAHSHLTQNGKHLNGTSDTSIDPNIDRANEPIYACPFLVMNVHRYAHFKNQSCHRAWTLPRLREHIIGRSKPNDTRHGAHTLYECEDCFQIFSKEHELTKHKYETPCQKASSYPFPAEGVGKFLAKKIGELSKGPKGDKRSDEDECTWNEWYRVLSGAAPSAQSCYFSVAIARCNDLGSLEDSENQLVRTFKRALPKEQKAEALECYLKSHRLVVLASLESRINQDELEGARMLLEHAATKSDRKKKRPLNSERSKAELADELAETHEPTTPNAAIREGPGLKDSPGFAGDMDHGSQWMSHFSPWETITDSGHPATPPSVQFVSWPATSSCGIATPEPVTLKNFMLREDTFFPLRNDTTDTLHEVKPRLVPHASQALPAVKETERSEHCHVKDSHGKIKIRTEIQQPSKSHGTFEQDPWDPQSTPSFATHPPPSDGLYSYNGLFNTADTGCTSWGTSYYTDST